MKVLITGAFGNVGTSAIKNFLSNNDLNIKLSCFDIKNDANLKKSSEFSDKVDLIWGDLRNQEEILHAVKGQDVIIHLAFLLPPLSESKPDLAKAINVGGTKDLLKAAEEQDKNPMIVFASSVSIFGPMDPDKKPPWKSSDAVHATDNYTSHKIECEKMLKEYRGKWVVCRFGVVPPLVISSEFDPIIFEIPLDNRLEFVHTMDVGLALANAAKCSDCAGKILLIGGGKRCQLYQREFISKFLDINGIGMLPDSAFSTKPYYTDWMDTTESQSLLQYQTRTFDDYIAEIKKLIGFKRYMIKLLGPLVRKSLLEKSPYSRKRPDNGA